MTTVALKLPDIEMHENLRQFFSAAKALIPVNFARGFAIARQNRFEYLRPTRLETLQIRSAGETDCSVPRYKG